MRAGGRTWKVLYLRGQCSVKLSESLFAALQWMVDGSSVPILIGNWNCVSMVATRLQRKCVFPKMKPCRTGNLCLRHCNGIGWLMVLQAIPALGSSSLPTDLPKGRHAQLCKISQFVCTTDSPIRFKKFDNLIIIAIIAYHRLSYEQCI